MAVEYPEKPTKRDSVLGAGRAVAEHLPWVGVAVSVFGEIFPDRIKDDQDRWQREVTDKLNELDRRSHEPPISHDSLAWLFALFVATRDREGTGQVCLQFDEWESKFCSRERWEIDEALAELSHAGWIETQSNANSTSGVGALCGTARLFAHTHPFIHQLYPSDDAKAIASYALTQEDAVSAMQIAEHFQWEKRQLYPALWYLADEIAPSDCIERMYHPDYPFIWLYLSGEVRRILRRFVMT